jgi:hypothetical protein
VKVDLVTGLGDEQENIISIYPNPTNNYMNISNLPSRNCDIILYNSSMQQIKLLQSSGSSDLRIDFNDLSSGVYFCKVVFRDDINIVRKIIVIK